MVETKFFPVIDPDGHSGKVKGIAYTPDGRFIVTASLDKTVRVWDRFTGRTVLTPDKSLCKVPFFSTPTKLQDFPFFEIRRR